VKQFRIISRSALLLFNLILFSTQTLAAESFPQPGNNKEVSLLGVYCQSAPGTVPGELRGKTKIHIEGPDKLSLKIDASEWKVLWFKVDPGLYTITPDNNLELSPGIPDSVEVPPSSVILAPFMLERSGERVRTRRLNEEVRQRSGTELALHIESPRWLRRDLIGFGTLRPALDPETQQYTVSINADPEGAEIYVDDVLAGNAPLIFSLTGGKHRILIRQDGFEDAVYYVRLEGDADIDAALVPTEAGPMEAGNERYTTLVAPFVSLGGQNDQLARLFADTLLLTLESDERLDVKPSTLPWVQRDALLQPDFLPLEEVGADLAVSGFFTEKDGVLGIQANLYDVQAETIRAAVTWYGSAGFDIFDAMDEIAEEFAVEVDRVLPAAGRTLITRQETVYSGVNRNESLLARKKIIRKRWRNRPNALSLQASFAGSLESFILNDNGSTRDVSISDGPSIRLTLAWDRDIAPRFAVGAGASYTSRSIRYDLDYDDSEPSWIASAYAGPRLVFRSLRTDILIGMDLLLRYVPQASYQWYDGVDRQADLGSFLSVELPMNVGFRYYFNKRIDTVPIFLNGGLGISFLGYRFDLGGTGFAGMIEPIISLDIGVGVRL